MEPVRRVVPVIEGPVDLNLILCPTVNYKTKLKQIQTIFEFIEECCRTQTYFDRMIYVLLKLLSITEPSFIADNDLFKIRKLTLQIIHKVCSSNDKIKSHIQNTMKTCLKVIETDNEQCVIYCILIFKELLTTFKPSFEGLFKTEISKFLKLIVNMYDKSNTPEKILNFQKTNDLKMLISQIRVTTTITKNSINYNCTPMGNVSFKVIKELGHMLKLCYLLFYSVQSFKNEIIESLPILMNFFNLDIPYKLEYKDLILDLKHSQVRLLSFFAIFLKDNKDVVSSHFSTLPGRVITLLNCNMSTDVSNLRTELLTGFESLILIDYKYEFLPYMDKFLDESLITGRSWSLKNILRPKAYIYIDHLITHLHSQLSLNFLVRVIHLHFSNILDSTLQPEVQINLCNMVMNVLSYIVHRQNQLITNINIIEHNKNPLTDLFYRIFHIFVIKLKQFQKFYLPQLDECSLAKENIQENISSILAENQPKEKQKEFVFGYHSSQIAPYTISDSRRFIKIIIPAIRTLFQFIVKIEGGKFAIDHRYKKLFKDFLKHSLLSLKICEGSIKKVEMVKEVLSALSCINSNYLKTIISGDLIVNQVYSNSLEAFFFDMTLNDEVLATTFSCLIFEFILKHLADEKERYHVLDLVNKLQLNFELNKNEEKAYEYVYKIIKILMNILPSTRYPVFYIEVLKSTLMIVQSAGYELGENMNSLLNCLFCDLLSYYHSLPSNLVITKNELAELCLSECVFKVALHPQIMDLLPVIAYSLQVSELTPQGLGILEKCLDILPDKFFDNPVLQVRNDIIQGLYNCLDSPFESISLPAVNLLGKFGGLNRSSILKFYDINPKEEWLEKTKTPNILVSFQHFYQSIEIDFGPGVNTAVETLISNDDEFIRNQSWNLLKGFFTVSMDYDADDFINALSHINWETCVHMFLNGELQYTKTIIDETYIKALTGLMICCSDDSLKADASKYFSEFKKNIIYISICRFSGFPCNYELEVHPFVLIDAIIIGLSNEKETTSNFSIIAAKSLIKELQIILGDNTIHFPCINYMFEKCCQLCYDTSWICKRAGCTGLQILFLNLITEEIMIIKYFNWFNQHFLTAFRAMLFTFSDPQGHLTFGAVEIAKSNLTIILNWFYLTQKTNASYNLTQETILKKLTDYIIGPNDLLREQSIEMVSLMAEKQGKTVLEILEPFYEYFKSSIPGNRLFHTYTFKSQIGIMKGHIFCALNSIPLEQFDSENSNENLRYYYHVLSTICRGINEDINKIEMLKCLTPNQFNEFYLTALQALGSSFNYLIHLETVKVYGILLDCLKSSDFRIQEISYNCLKPHCGDEMLINMVDKLLFSYTASIENHDKMTLISIRHVLYLSKLFPSYPNAMFCSKLVSAFKLVWNDVNHCSNHVLKNELKLILENILGIVSVLTETQFCNVKELCEIILVEDVSIIDLCDRLYPWLFDCVLKYPTEFLALFFQDKIKKSVWSSFFNSMIYCEKCEALRKVMTSDGTHLETLLLSSRMDPTRSMQYESIKIIYNLMKTDKKWIATKKIISILLNIWGNAQYKERFKNLAAIKSTEWDEPKMLLKIVLTYYRENLDEVIILFQLLPVFSYRFPVDVNFFRRFLENEIVNCTVKWKRMVFFKFLDLYLQNTVNGDILGKILQYLILPGFAMSYKNGEKEPLLCSFIKSDENIITVILNKIFNNIRVVLTGCDFDGVKVFLCQLICMLIEDLLNVNENIPTLIYNAIIPCTSQRCAMDLNVKCHCYLILTLMLLSGNVPRDENLKEALYNELLKASFAEAQPVIDHSLNLIIMTVCENKEEINALVECIKKMMKNEFQSVPTLHRICSFVLKYNTLFYPFKQDLIRNLIGSLFPMAKNNNIPEFKKTALELACMIIKWEVADENVNINFPTKRKIDEVEIIEENHNSSLPKKKSSENIDNSLNFLAMVGCQTHDDKQESRISKLAICSAKLFKTILATEPIERSQVKLKFAWIEKLLDNFLKKENIVKQNPNAHGNTNASVMNLLTTFDILAFMLNVLSEELMLEAIKPLQNILVKFLQIAFNEEITFSYPQNQKDILLINQLTVSQYNEKILKVITEILKTFPSNEGLENLHSNIQMIIAKGLISHNPQQLEISLVLLEGSLTHFAHYMDSEILNTIGDIMFKFNENNGNPVIKVKCLEVLKIHINTLSKSKKQLFIEKVVMENLDKARCLENSIPFEVQKKCFELIIDYIQDLSQATEGVLLNSILLEYIKTTTDERIMELILDVISKWIDICKNKRDLFNSHAINILKTTIDINRFPKLTEYSYKLNLEIFKNWKYRECIEYGINCKYPSIRYDFINFYVSLWKTSGICSTLYSIMNYGLSFEVEFSIPFYIQFLFVKISQQTNIEGNFQLLKMKESCRKDMYICPVKSCFTFNVCSSLAQLCFVDVHLAKQTWISIIPKVWSLFTDFQREALSKKSVEFLTNSKLKNNFLTTLYEAIILCKPKIDFEPHQMVYIGKTYNLWYTVIGQLEDIYNYSERDKKDKAIEGMIQMYSLLREEDVLEYLFQSKIKCEDTKKALSLEYLGYFEDAKKIYIGLYNHDLNVYARNQRTSYNPESEFRKVHLTKCLRELNDWNGLSETILNENDFLLKIEKTWKNSIENSTCDSLKFDLEHKQKIWPCKLIWKYHFYLGMLGLNKLNEHNLSTVQMHVEFCVKDIINKWKVLPKYLCDAHIPLLQATQLIVEVQEAYITQKSWLQTPQNDYKIDALVESWNKRKPWIGDNSNVWSDLISWRQTYYSFLSQNDLILKINSVKSLQDQSKLLFGEIAIKQNMTGVCLKALKSIDPNNASTFNWLHKMFLEAKCVQKAKSDNEFFNEIANSPVNKSFTDDMNPLLLTIRGSFQGYYGNTALAFKNFATAFLDKNKSHESCVDWKRIIEDNFDNYCSGNNETLPNNFLTNLNRHEILENAWIQWGTLIQNYFSQSSYNDMSLGIAALECYIIAFTFANHIKCNILTARILWLLSYDDEKCALLNLFGKSNNIAFSDFWIPQMLNIIVEKNESTIQLIFSKIGKIHPQKIYLTLNRMYLAEKMITTTELDTCADIEKNNDCTHIETGIKKINKIKLMMDLMKKYNLHILQLDYFVDQIISLGENWIEELRRNLYECFYMCYDFAFKKKCLFIPVSCEILKFIENKMILFVTQGINTDDVTEGYKFLKDQFPLDFKFDPVPSIKHIVGLLKNWIKYVENNFNYTQNFVRDYRCSTIHDIDWSVIKLPSDHFIDDSSKAVKIHNFSGNVYLKDKCGTTVKQLFIRGTNGLLYTYNISGGQGVESEESIFQLFHMTNNYLLDFKETTKRFLKFSIPKTFTISPNLRMIETKSSNFTLFDMYREMINAEWVHEDIEFWFTVFNAAIMIGKPDPLLESLFATSVKYGSGNVMKNWVSLRYPSILDYWTFRKTFIEHYSLICFFEYAYNLIKLKPEMLNIDKNNGAAAVLNYTFSFNKINGKFTQNFTTAFRFTPTLSNFITPFRKCQMKNCLTATGLCLINNIDEISIVLKLILKNELTFNYITKNNENSLLSKHQILELVDKNLNCILENLNIFRNVPAHNSIPDLLHIAYNMQFMIHENPTWRPWL